MVKETKKDGVVYNICEACGFKYKEEKYAQKCEEWCKEHNSCNMDITHHSVQD
jgi:hypothetical protein